MIVLDKTGTITEGKPSLTDVIAAPGLMRTRCCGWRRQRRKTASTRSRRRLCGGAVERGLRLSEPTEFRAVVGSGVEATVMVARSWWARRGCLNSAECDWAWRSRGGAGRPRVERPCLLPWMGARRECWEWRIR